MSFERSDAPYWSADGREIFYFNRDTRTLHSVTVDVGNDLRIVSRTPLFELNDSYILTDQNFVDPHGRGFVFVKRNDQPRPLPVVVVNFIEEVKARLGNQ